MRELAFEQIEAEQDLYEAVRAVEWERWMTPDTTFRVHFNVHSSLLRNTRFGLYRIKDAVCDRMLDRTGRRPSVAAEAPDLYLTCYLENRRLSIGLDAAGEPLHMRGYRVAQHETSLREHLAAAMVLMSGWEPSRPLHDPFCGSGTILIEAAMIATNTPPSHYRKRYGCMGWADFDRTRFEDLRQEAEAAIRPMHRLRISGADRDERAVRMARDNLRSSGFDATVEVQTRRVRARRRRRRIHHHESTIRGARGGRSLVARDMAVLPGAGSRLPGGPGGSDRRRGRVREGLRAASVQAQPAQQRADSLRARAVRDPHLTPWRVDGRAHD